MMVSFVGTFDAQKAEINLWETLMFTLFFLTILQRNRKFVILGNLVMPGHTHLKFYYSSKKPLMCIYRQKKLKLAPTFFCRYCKHMQNLFGYFGYAWLPKPNMTVNLQKILMFICMPKIHFIIHVFLDILHFKKPCKLIGQKHFGP